MENEKHLADDFINGLKEGASTLENWQLQFALGKAEASEKIDEAKTKFKDLIHNAKLKFIKGESKFDELKAKLEHIELQIALGKMEAKDEIEDQKKNISKNIHEIEAFFKNKL